jgi:hypothetical protein
MIVYPECIPVLPLSDHLPHTVHNVQYTQASLHSINRLVEMRARLFSLQKSPFLVYDHTTELGSRVVESHNRFSEVGRIGTEGA